jgi:chromosome segregation ATPase
MTDLLGSSSEHKLRVLKTQLVRVIRLFHNRNRMHGDSNEVDRLRVQCKKLEADLDAVLSESGNLHIEVTFLKGTLQTLQQERAQTQTKLKDFEQKLQIYDGNLSNILRMNIQEITDTEDKLAKTLKLLSNQKESLIKQ